MHSRMFGKNKGKTNNKYLPQELFILVLACLPIKSLIRFRCVCRSWNSLITSPFFINTHLNRASTTTTTILSQTKTKPLIFRWVCKLWNSLITSPFFVNTHLNRASTTNILTQTKPLIFRWMCKLWNSLITSPLFINTHLNRANTNILSQIKPLIIMGSQFQDTSLRFNHESLGEYLEIGFPCETRHIRVIGYCNGVACLETENSDLYLWNPSIKKCVTLQVPQVPWHSPTVDGFGFDLRNNDYKVLRIAGQCPDELEIYSLNAKAWKNIDISLQQFRSRRLLFCFSAFLNGVVYWLAGGKWESSVQKFVIGFDLSYETFEEILLPEWAQSSEIALMSISVFKASLAVAAERLMSEGLFDFWLMNEYGADRICWTKQFSIRKPILRAVACGQNGELLIQTRFKGLSVLYNPKGQVVDYSYFSRYNRVYVDSYVESLALIDQDDKIFLGGYYYGSTSYSHPHKSEVHEYF